jgi:DNA invertase Pin-like site-specific DNA recombinase
MPAIERAAAYYRMSKDEQEHSIERQEGQVVPYAARKGYDVVRVYKDEGIAGWKDGDGRPDFRRLLADARKGLFNVILCDDVDRFGRFDIHKYGAIVDPLRAAGIRLETVAQGLIDWEDTLSQLSDAIRMVFKREQSNDTARRILTRFIQLAREGKWVCGTPPYGYVKDSATQRLALGDPAKVRVVRWLFETYATRDVSLRWLSRELLARGVENPSGRPNKDGVRLWTGQALGKLLRNRNYLGDLHWNEVSKGEFQEYDGRAVVKRRTRGERRRPGAELIVVPDSHPPLIDRDTFEVVQAKLTGNRARKTPLLAGGDFLLSGMLVCGHCGSWMVGRRGLGGGKDTRRPVYLCNGYNRWGKGYCKCHWVEERRILPAIIRRLTEDFLNPDNLRALREEIRRQDEEAARQNPDDAKQLRAKINALDRDIARGNRNMALAQPDAIAGIAEVVRGWRDERDRLATEVAAIERGLRPSASAEAELDEAEAQLWRLREALTNEDGPEVRAVLQELVSRVELWFEHREVGRYTKTKFARGLIYLRPDDLIVRSCQLFQWSGTGTTASAPSVFRRDSVHSAHNSPISSASASPAECFIRRTTSRSLPS